MTFDSLLQAIETTSVQGLCNDHRAHNRFNCDVRFFSKGLKVNYRLLRNVNLSSSRFKLYSIDSSPIRSSAVDQIPSSSKSTRGGGDPGNIQNESALILIRHGESFWNEKNLFSGCVDVPLTKKGIEEAIEAGKRISSIPIDIIYTSALARAQMTAMLALTQHRCEKVPIIIHDESEESKIWSKIYSQETKKQSIPVVKAWQLNERMYGELQGFNKRETAKLYGKEKVYEWRRSYGACPPNGESLEICSQRAVAYFREKIEPQLVAGKHVMVAAHANSLRAIIIYLDKLNSKEIVSLELSNAEPMLYLYKEGKFMRRGSPLGLTAAGVYAHSWDLALFRQKLDEMSP